MKYRFAAFKKEDGWYILKENSRFEVVLVKVPSNKVFRVREKAYNPRTNEMYYEDLGMCWEGEI